MQRLEKFNARPVPASGISVENQEEMSLDPVVPLK